MKKIFIFSFIFLFCLLLSGCSGDAIVLTCSSDDITTVTTIKNNRIVNIKENGVSSNVSENEWKEIKDFYEFNDDVTNAKIARTLKKKNEENGFNCKVR